MASPVQVTALLNEWQSGNSGALERLYPLVYDELRRIARAQRRGSKLPQTLNTTALVHEAYLKLAGADEVSVHDRAHFMALSARAMRQVLINYIHHKGRSKRGGGREAQTLLESYPAGEAPLDLLLAINDALEKLSIRSPRMAQIVECRFFAGLSVEETAQVLDMSVRSVEREWTRAKLYLTSLLNESGSDE